MLDEIVSVPVKVIWAVSQFGAVLGEELYTVTNKTAYWTTGPRNLAALSWKDGVVIADFHGETAEEFRQIDALIGYCVRNDIEWTMA